MKDIPEAFAERYREGVPTRKLAIEFGVTRKTLQAWRDKLELPARREARKPLPLQDVLRLHEQGNHPTEIARLLGVQPRSVADILRRHGLEPNRGSTRPHSRTDASRARRMSPPPPKPCPRCYSPMLLTEHGYECARHGAPAPAAA